MFLHVREAHKKFIEVLKPNQNSIPKAVVHCFTGTKKELVEYIDMDLYIGITGWLCDERRGTHLKDLIQLIPIDRIMAETDSPYLVPRNLNSIKTRRNEPKFLPHIVEEIVSNLDRSKSSIISSIYMNSLNFFNINL